MSSIFVRNSVKNFLTTNAPTENQIDLFGTFQTMPELLADNGLVHDDPWLGLEFIANDEIPITVGSNNTQGKYREDGAIYFHVVAVASLGSSGTILSRGEALRDLLRGRRIADDIIVESVSPLNFNSGATLQFEGGYVSASFLLSYQYDRDM